MIFLLYLFIVNPTFSLNVTGNGSSSNLQCDGREHISYYMIQKGYLERILFTSIESKSDSWNQSLDRVYGINKSIGDTINCVTNTHVGNSVESYLNSIDDYLVSILDSLLMDNNQKFDDTMKHLTRVEKELFESLKSNITNNSKFNELYQVYKHSTINQLNSIHKKNYTTSFLYLDKCITNFKELGLYFQTNLK